MDFLEIMRQRKSCRSYRADKPVSREDLLKIVEAGRLTPSGCNSQPWKFIVVDSPEAKEKLCDAIVTDEGTTGAPWRHQVAAFVIFVEQRAKIMPAVENHYHTTQRFAQGDIGAACIEDRKQLAILDNLRALIMLCITNYLTIKNVCLKSSYITLLMESIVWSMLCVVQGRQKSF